MEKINCFICGEAIEKEKAYFDGYDYYCKECGGIEIYLDYELCDSEE